MVWNIGTIKVDGTPSTSNIPLPFTVKEADEYDLANQVFATNGPVEVEPTTNRVIEWIGRKAATIMKLKPVSTALAPKLVATVNNRPAIVCGMTEYSGGSIIAGEGNRYLSFEPNFKWPGIGTGAVAGAPVLNAGALQSIPVAIGGAGYLAPANYTPVAAGLAVAPKVVFGVPGGGVAPTAHAVVSAAGVVTGIVVDSAGSGLDSNLTVTLVAQMAPGTLSLLFQPLAFSSSLNAFVFIGDRTKGVAISITGGGTPGSSRVYPDRIGAPNTSMTGVAGDFGLTGPTIMSFVFDGTGIALYRGDTLLKTQAQTLLDFSSRQIGIGAELNSLGAVVSAAEMALWRAAIFPSADVAARNAFKAVALEWFPAMATM